MKNKFFVLTLGMLLLGTSGQRAETAELLGSDDPEIRKNFNQLITTNACSLCNLRGVVLNRVNLAGANLEGANLEGAQLNLAHLVGANFRQANLRNASLGAADVSQADFRGATLTGSLWGGAYLLDALFDPGQHPRQNSPSSHLMPPPLETEAPILGVDDPLPDIFAPPVEFLASPQPAAVAESQGAKELEHHVADIFSAFTPRPREKSLSTKVAQDVDGILVLDAGNASDLVRADYGFWDAFTLFLKPSSKVEAPSVQQTEQVEKEPLEIIINNHGQKDPRTKEQPPHSKAETPRMNVLSFSTCYADAA
jgi:hypothetical protein